MKTNALFLTAFLLLVCTDGLTASDRVLADAHDRFVAAHASGGREVALSLLDTIRQEDRGPKFASLSLVLNQPLAQLRMAELSAIPLRSQRMAGHCSQAAALSAPFAFTADGETGAELWLRIDEDLQISTVGSMADTRIEVFEHCEDEPIAVYDDEFGLAAVAAAAAGQRLRITQTDAGRLVIRGQISAFVGGTVVTADTGLPLERTEVRVYDETGGFYLNHQTYSQPRYEVTLEVGEYYVSAGMASVTNHAVPAYQAQIYAGVDCESVNVFACNNYRTHATRVAVVSADPVDGIDFSLSRANYLTGHMRDEEGHPIAGSVRVYRDSDHFPSYAGSARSDGLYSLHGIDPGPYYVVVTASGFVPQLYPGIECSSDSCTTERRDGHETLAIFADSELSQVDFTLRARPRFSGRVTEHATGLPLSSTYVRVYRGDGAYVAQEYTDSQGFYVTDGLPDGDYKVRATKSGYVETWYGGLECSGSGCSDQATAITLNSDQSDIDVALRQLGTISGQVTDVSGSPLINPGDVQVCFIAGTLLHDCVFASIDGSYELVGAPLNGTAVVARADHYYDQLFDRVNCEAYSHDESQCDSSDGQIVLAEPDSSVAGIDFFLQSRGQLRVTMLDQADGTPLQGALVSVLKDGRVEAQDWSDSNGLMVASPLDAGTYHIVASKQAFGLQAYAGVYCPGSLCTSAEYDAAVTVELAEDEVRPLQFELFREPQVGFQARTAEGEDFAVSRVCWFRIETSAFSCSFSDTLTLVPGSYRFFVESNDNYAQALGGPVCPNISATSCLFDSGVAHNLAIGQTLDLVASVTRLPRFRILATGPTWSGGIRNYSARLYDENGTFLGDVSGEFSAEPGRYKIVAGAPGRYYTAHPDVFCESENECVEQAEIVEVGETGVYTIELQVFPDYGVFGRVTDSTGTPLPEVDVDFWNRAGDYLGDTPTNSDGFYWWAGDNVYHLSTRNTYGLEDIVYPNLPCPGAAQSGACDPTEGAIVFGIPSEVMENRHDMALAGRVRPMAMFFSGFEDGEDN